MPTSIEDCRSGSRWGGGCRAYYLHLRPAPYLLPPGRHTLQLDLGLEQHLFGLETGTRDRRNEATLRLEVGSRRPESGGSAGARPRSPWPGRVASPGVASRPARHDQRGHRVGASLLPLTSRHQREILPASLDRSFCPFTVPRGLTEVGRIPEKRRSHVRTGEGV